MTDILHAVGTVDLAPINERLGVVLMGALLVWRLRELVRALRD